MEEKRYSISEASEILNLETHVLRYWEEELNLEIPRNEMGHRYYTDQEIRIFENIKHFKEQGLQLRAIKAAISSMDENEDYALKLSHGNEVDITNPNDEKVKQFQMMMKNLFKEALVEHNHILRKEIKEELKQDLKEEMLTQIKFLEKEYEARDKERYKRLDEVLREVQNMRKETAVAASRKIPWYKHIFGR
ncbi:MAG: MerR family transcriptional regulator [Defluviitaleaceae bacterium]|jgi:DNA-binding transcriptional MerR regulator|uniref:MerR family transcriptional regulator n=1 Tax=Defluviitalea raffinosedens TaxID=1450156 RepID=A0A7C8HEE9_9FIRM|nr:helix-turn-helix domain-containing protein [Defluviitalea raffinosedens]KAE9632966.1 MerR family transcriptional regulator [Defluviitalea raffinosedens]MBZ4669215.1 MerR family transcriptional regulator [Defluviitaleaceae bacterium]